MILIQSSFRVRVSFLCISLFLTWLYDVDLIAEI
jgi:hypothetical protein